MSNEYQLSFTGSEVDSKLRQIDTLSKSIPTKTSQLTNDSGFLTKVPDSLAVQTLTVNGKSIDELIQESIEETLLEGEW